MPPLALRSNLPPTPLLGCRYYSQAVFMFFCLFLLVWRIAAHPRFPPRFRRSRLQDLVYLIRKLTKIMMGWEFIFLAEEK